MENKPKKRKAELSTLHQLLGEPVHRLNCFRETDTITKVQASGATKVYTKRIEAATGVILSENVTKLANF